MPLVYTLSFILTFINLSPKDTACFLVVTQSLSKSQYPTSPNKNQYVMVTRVYIGDLSNHKATAPGSHRVPPIKVRERKGSHHKLYLVSLE